MKTMSKSEGEMLKEKILCIDNNLDALIWRLRVIEAAKKELVFVTFDTEDDLSGRALMAALLHAAERGGGAMKKRMKCSLPYRGR